MKDCARQWVFPGRTRGRVCYVGRGGVTVIVAPRRGEDDNLVTCYRAISTGGPNGLEKNERAAVRRAARLASLDSERLIDDGDAP